MAAAEEDVDLGHTGRDFRQMAAPSHPVPNAMHVDRAVGTPLHPLQEGQVQHTQLTFTEADFPETGPFGLRQYLKATSGDVGFLEQQLFQFGEGALAQMLHSLVSQRIQAQIKHLQEGPLYPPQMLKLPPVQLILAEVQPAHESPSSTRQSMQSPLAQPVSLQFQNSHEARFGGYPQQQLAETALREFFHLDLGLPESPLHLCLHELAEEHPGRQIIVRAGQLQLSCHPYCSIIPSFLFNLHLIEMQGDQFAAQSSVDAASHDAWLL